MKSSTKRPIFITILATAMITSSLLFFCDRILHFYLYRFLEAHSPAIDGDYVNLQIVSDITFLGVSLVPMVLAIGLWTLKSWARFLSICFFSALAFPAIAASLKIISPPSVSKLMEVPTVFDGVFSTNNNASVSLIMTLNPYIAISSTIALTILLIPAIGKSFQENKRC
ncbi:hypothetical protein [Pseudanabaena mucicola]|uniref:Uncharacterized protein n=1 Tax=Pseudanabaena mucicola FACHB-723 TaxID=2692860 RepID=A0ABR7ZS64_9CYAN|nr:hypothetical protein [Pseudanabaena mucicola]MBD2186798.1 hypothetical protein [Pseudanabaena mucicola FACHB-723]